MLLLYFQTLFLQSPFQSALSSLDFQLGAILKAIFSRRLDRCYSLNVNIDQNDVENAIAEKRFSSQLYGLEIQQLLSGSNI